MSNAIPLENKRLRACLRCSLVKTILQFKASGCDNCERVLRMRGSLDKVMEYTTPSFQGMIAMIDPTSSWVAKWKGMRNSKAGVYAMSVDGSLSKSILKNLEENV